MTRRSFATIALAAALCAPSIASAQQQTLKLTSPGSTVALGVYVGPYNAQATSNGSLFAAGSLFKVYCVDYYNHISMNSAYTANVTNLQNGNMANTRFGAGELTDYRKAFYLTTLFSTTATSQWGDLHASIWSLLGGSPNVPNGVFVTQANSWYSTTGVNADWSNAYVLTDVNMSHGSNGQYYPGRGGVQEFVTGSFSLHTTNVVPEPSTYVLLGAGLVAVFGASRRKKQATPAA